MSGPDFFTRILAVILVNAAIAGIVAAGRTLFSRGFWAPRGGAPTPHRGKSRAIRLPEPTSTDSPGAPGAPQAPALVPARMPAVPVPTRQAPVPPVLQPQGEVASIAELTLAMAVHFGRPEKPELDQIRRIIREITDTQPESDRARAKESARAVLDRYKAMSAPERRSSGNLDRACAHIHSAHPSLRRFAFECAARISACRERDLRPLNQTLCRVADALRLDSETVTSVRDRHLRVERITGASVAERLGAEPQWNRERLRSFLQNEFKKWNGRAAHPNPEIAEEALERIRLIGEASAVLKPS